LSLKNFHRKNQEKTLLKIWFNKPAENWNEALPVGNGRLGAMIFGNVENERLEINEESVWTGGERWDANPDALKNLPKERQLLFDGKFAEAEKRELNIEEAVARVSYTLNQADYLREIFSSTPDQAIVIRLTANKPGSLTFTAMQN
jgi:alpha-L-fucosidase 2